MFLTHECLIPTYGDYVMARMAEDNVIVCRQKDGSIRAFINSCTHRGNQVCHAESGNARAFVCNYHGWVYGTDGALVEVPLEERCHVQVDKSARGLPSIRVESYRGFVYGCFDEAAPLLAESLGDFGWYLDTWMVGDGGGVELLGPPAKSTLDCNWKVSLATPTTWVGPTRPDCRSWVANSRAWPVTRPKCPTTILACSSRHGLVTALVT